MKGQNVVLEKSFNFSLKVIELFKLMQLQREYIISKQLLRSGTSIGANINESTAAVSRQDFIFKLTIASKEARETKYWLDLLERSKVVNHDLTPYIIDSEELIRLLTSIVKTSKQNMIKSAITAILCMLGIALIASVTITAVSPDGHL
jgi:four helix bundle protein